MAKKLVRPEKPRALVPLGLAVVAAIVAVTVWPVPRGGKPAQAGFVGRASCIECHAEQHEAWSGSHHDLAMDVANEQTVLGDFADATFEHYSVTSRFFRQDGRYFVHTDGPDGKLADFEIKYVFGVEPLQQYLIELDRGRLQTLQISWDTQRKRWFHIHDEQITHDDPLHWTSLQFNWNFMCAECHSTNLQKNYDAKTRTYTTAWSEIDVSCEACHGPCSNHLEWAREEGPDPAKGLLVSLKGKAQVEACARCHSRRTLVSGDYEHGRPFLDHYAPSLLERRLYHSDGQILDEVYVYGSFLQTKKSKSGVRCTHCHDAHTARLRMPGNALCQQCHQPTPPAEFDTLTAGLYDTPEHHFHKEPILCVDCHMPARTYMAVDPRRDHSFRVPRPDLTVKLGTPNACSVCHEDKSAQWAVDAVEKWYPQSDKRGYHFAQALATRNPDALAQLADDKEQPAIARATAITLLPRPRAAALKDSDPLVRMAAVRGFYGRADPVLLTPLLKDPVRAVRVEAARVLASVRALHDNEAFRAALEEFKQRQAAQAERPEAHLNLGVMHADLGDSRAAEQAYLTALGIDDGFLPVRFNLSNLYNALGRNADAETQLRAILKRVPDDGEACYSLGLLLAEMRRPDEAARYLQLAVDRLPGRARVLYNYGLLLQQLRRLEEAEAALLEAVRLTPRDRDALNALVILCMQQGQWKRALPYAERLSKLAPRAADVRRMLQRIRMELAR